MSIFFSMMLKKSRCDGTGSKVLHTWVKAEEALIKNTSLICE